ncbi:exosortase A [Paucibacter sediminis]|uniref:Exosortase A n=1 Tax=Paucibacter sediminis TaxID=3019553 RepID=A0AA95NC43_9BURK|nr:exosortase A [Paucibacter sp. S2-9]WIT11349.1 exosortase A [Paucibacter sp. S2-9]
MAEHSSMTMQTSGLAAGKDLRDAWRRHGVVLTLLWLGLFLGYRDTALGMQAIWERSETFAHAYLVLPISCWLVWRQRAALAFIRPTGWWPALLGLGAGGLLWLLGELGAFNALTQYAFVIMLVSAVLAALGPAVGWAIAFPLAFLFFAVPAGEVAMPQLMTWTADFTVAALRLSGLPVYREGLNFVIPSGNWSVVEACSGVRYLIASVMVGTLFAYLNYRSLRRRLLFVLVALLLPVLANWVRAYLIVMLGHLSGNELATGADHLIYGWVFFGVVMFAMFMIGARWSEPELPALPQAARAAAALAGSASRIWWVAALSAALIAAAPLWLRAQERGLPVVHLQTPTADGPAWETHKLDASEWSPTDPGADGRLHLRYSREQRDVGLYMAFYASQRAEHKLISSVNTLVRSEDPQWTLEQRQLVPLRAAASDLQALRADVAPRLQGHGRGNAESMVLLQLYWVNGAWTAEARRAQWWLVRDRLLGRSDLGATVVVYARSAEGQRDVTQQQLNAFLVQHLPALERSLGRAVEGRP